MRLPVKVGTVARSWMFSEEWVMGHGKGVLARRRRVPVWQVVRGGLLALLAGLSGTVATAAPFAYYTVNNDGRSGGTLIDWQRNRAQVVTIMGRGAGTVVAEATQRVITLDAPLVQEFAAVDACSASYVVRSEVTGIVVRDTGGGLGRGESELLNLGRVTYVGGCQDGTVVPGPAPTDPGLPMQRIALALKPSIADLQPGVRLAGPMEAPGLLADVIFTGQDIATFNGDGTATLAASGNVVPVRTTADGWLVFTHPGFERAYLRLATDTSNGIESWLMADWSAEAPQRLIETLMVKPAASAGFGPLLSARMWEHGLFSASPTSNQRFDLYPGGSGERVIHDVASGVDTRTPLTWQLTGAAITLQRASGASTATRTWTPLLNRGRSRAVMESEMSQPPSGPAFVTIRPRVTFVVDRGAAVAPPTLAGASAGSGEGEGAAAATGARAGGLVMPR